MSLDQKLDVQHCDQELALHSDAKVVESATPGYVEGTPEEKKLVRKIDMHLIPILWAMYVFNYLDRTNIGVRTEPSTAMYHVPPPVRFPTDMNFRP